MPIFFDGDAPFDIRVGATPVVQIWVGTRLVWDGTHPVAVKPPVAHVHAAASPGVVGAGQCLSAATALATAAAPAGVVHAGVTVAPPAAQVETVGYVPSLVTENLVDVPAARVRALAHPAVGFTIDGVDVSVPLARVRADAHPPVVASGNVIDVPAAHAGAVAYPPVVCAGQDIAVPAGMASAMAHTPAVAAGQTVTPPAARLVARAPSEGTVGTGRPALWWTTLDEGGVATAWADGTDTQQLVSSPGTITGVALDDDGCVFFSDASTGTVSCLRGGTIHTDVTGLSVPYGIACYDGDLYIAEAGAQRITRWDGTSKHTVASGQSIYSVAVAPDGTVWAAGYGALYRADSGGFTKVATLTGVGYSVALLDGDVYVPSGSDVKVWNGTSLTTAYSGFDTSAGLTTEAGDLIVTDQETGEIWRCTGGTKTLLTTSAPPAAYIASGLRTSGAAAHAGATIAVPATAVTATAHPAEFHTDFRDDFSSATVDPSWIQDKGSWTIDSGAITVNSTNALIRQPITWLGSDCYVEAKITVSNGIYQGFGPVIFTSETEYYALYVRNQGGGVRDTSSDLTTGVNPGTISECVARIEKRGSEYTFLINGKTKYTHTGRFDVYGVGLYMNEGASGYSADWIGAGNL